MEMEVEGLDEILQNLAKMNIEEDIENKALNKAATITRDAVKGEAPESDVLHGSKLKENIRVKRAKDGTAYVHTDRAYHAHILEGGRSAGSTMAKKNGKLQKVTWGPIPPNPFFSRGFEQSKISSQQAMIDEIKKGLNL